MQKPDFINRVANSPAPPPAGTPHGYRPDIDGLRAIAVLSVVAYHFDIGRVPGGFTGVDVFFVISGFLITDIIKSGLESGSFSFLGFYRRRIRRIFPALLLVLAAYLAAAFLSLTGGEAFSVAETMFQNLCWSIVAAAAFFTNFTQLHEANYFSQTAMTSPLLHLWSLAIEEQFYVFWPLLLWSMRTIGAKYLPFIVVIAAISFSINILTVYAHPTIAFYSPLSRAWELMLGAALACAPPNKIGPLWTAGNARSAAGLVMIVVGLFATNWKSTFPGWWALLPAVGTVLVISADRDAFLNRHILGAKFPVWIGLISYPLYLWHWPALLLYQEYSASLARASFARPVLKAVAILCAIGASWLTYRFVEIPVRFGKWRGPVSTAAIALLMAVVGAVAAAAPSVVLFFTPLTAYQRETMNSLRRVPDVAKTYEKLPCFFNSIAVSDVPQSQQDACLVPRHPGRKTVFLLGDSHSAALSIGLRPLVESSGANFLQAATGFPCEPTNNDRENATCSDVNKTVIEKIAASQPDVVVIDSFWTKADGPPSFVGGGDFLGHLLATIENIERHGAKRVIVVGQMPIWPPSLPDSLAHNFVQKDLPIPRRTFVGVDAESLRIDAVMKVIKYPPAATYLSVKEALCDDDGCLTKVGSDLAHDLIVYDNSHLTPAASEFLAGSLMKPALSGLLENR